MQGFQFYRVFFLFSPFLFLFFLSISYQNLLLLSGTDILFSLIPSILVHCPRAIETGSLSEDIQQVSPGSVTGI